MEKKWVAKWIGEGENCAQSHGVILRKTFKIANENNIALYISGLGLFKAYINGHEISETFFDAGESNFAKTVYYVKYDITNKIKKGENTIDIVLGNGQYVNFVVNPTMEKNGELIEPHRYQKNDGYILDKNIYGFKKAICEIYEENALIAKSDESWLCAQSKITFNNWYGGEDFDSTKEYEWKNAVLMPCPMGQLKERDFNPIKVCEEIKAEKIIKHEKGYTIDFGKNGAGVVKINLETTPSMRGVKIKMLPSEEITNEGFADQKSSTQSWSETKKCEISDSYVIGGTGNEEWHPLFCYHGFRYLEVHNLPYKPKENTFTYLRLMADNEKTGFFETDNEILQKINRMTDRSIESNMFFAFTDCPQIEKLGWIETSHLMFNSMAYGRNIKNWTPKIVQDMADSVAHDGYMPAIVPPFQLIPGLDKDVNWGGACIMTPWYYYEYYNDKKVLYTAKEAGKKYLEHLESHMTNNLLENYSQMGDWGQINEKTPTVLVENCALYLLYVTYAKLLTAIGENGEEYLKKAEKLKKAFHENEICYNKDNKVYGNGSQASYGCVLFSGIYFAENEKSSVEKLVDAVKKADFHLTSGEVGLKQVFATLNKYGHDNVVYKMVTNKTQPSYFYFAQKDLTCLPEYWNYEELWWGMVRSRNHAMMGHVKEWLIRGVLGVRYENLKNITIMPYVPENTTYAKGSFYCGKGKFEVFWKVNGKKITIKVSNPEDVKVSICAPEGYELEN